MFPACKPLTPSTTTCFPLNTVNEVELSISDAVEIGFPLYLPSPHDANSMGLTFPPHILFKSYNSTCSYLQIPVHRLEEKKPIVTMQISNGCAYPISSALYSGEINLAWAENHRSYIVENDSATIVIVREATHGFQYIISSEKPLDFIIDLLESMQLVS